MGEWIEGRKGKVSGWMDRWTNGREGRKRNVNGWKEGKGRKEGREM